jgi:hypothetical protein
MFLFLKSIFRKGLIIDAILGLFWDQCLSPEKEDKFMVEKLRFISLGNRFPSSGKSIKRICFLDIK